jgi:UDP-glucose-4-epimerase GalE|nr:UDP-glucose 4-epimerase GalE [Kofleriaceae bacterium]
MAADKQTILVTGGAGFVGSHFARAAHEAGHRVVVYDDLSAGTNPRLPTGVGFAFGDIGDAARLTQVIREQEITAYVHFAGKICVGESVEKPAMYFDRNLVRTITLLDVVLEHAPQAFLFSSTAAVYGMPEVVPIVETARLAPINPYGSSKLAVESVLAAYGHAYGLRWGALRYFNASGAHPDGSLREDHDPETHLIPLAIDAALGKRPALTVFGTDYETTDGTCVRDYVHVCDLATAHLAAIDALVAGREVGAVNLGSSTGFTVREVVDEVGRVVGAPVPHSLGPRRAGDPAVLLASNARARDLLGWTPARSELAVVIDDAVRSRRPR